MVYTEEDDIATIIGTRLPNDRENARLMAAAPDLLDAIQRIATMASRDGNGIHHDMRMIRMLAIKTALKATGETQ